MLYAFFLFWPANILPYYLLISLLQIFIPLNLIMRSLAVGQKQHKKHILAVIVIFSAVIINSIVLKDNWTVWGPYYFIFLASCLCDVISHALKELLVRSMPLEQTSFNFKISISQLVCGIVLIPIVLPISRKYENY